MIQKDKQGSFKGFVKIDGWPFFQVPNLVGLPWDERPYFLAPGLDTGGLVQSLSGEDLVEEEMATHSSILVWKVP